MNKELSKEVFAIKCAETVTCIIVLVVLAVSIEVFSLVKEVHGYTSTFTASLDNITSLHTEPQVIIQNHTLWYLLVFVFVLTAVCYYIDDEQVVEFFRNLKTMVLREKLRQEYIPKKVQIVKKHIVELFSNEKGTCPTVIMNDRDMAIFVPQMITYLSLLDDVTVNMKYNQGCGYCTITIIDQDDAEHCMIYCTTSPKCIPGGSTHIFVCNEQITQPITHKCVIYVL